MAKKNPSCPRGVAVAARRKSGMAKIAPIGGNHGKYNALDGISYTYMAVPRITRYTRSTPS